MGTGDSKHSKTQYLSRDKCSSFFLEKIPYQEFLLGIEEELQEWNKLLHNLKGGLTTNNKQQFRAKLIATEESLRKYNNTAVIQFPCEAWPTIKPDGKTKQSHPEGDDITAVTTKEEDGYTVVEKTDAADIPSGFSTSETTSLQTTEKDPYVKQPPRNTGRTIIQVGTSEQSSPASAKMTLKLENSTVVDKTDITDTARGSSTTEPSNSHTTRKVPYVRGLEGRLKKHEAPITRQSTTATTGTNGSNPITSKSDVSTQITNENHVIELEKKNYDLTVQLEEEKYTVADLTAKIQTLITGNDKIRQEKDDLLTRLSKLAGEKLTKDNPSITDLSDRNRPTKLGEMYAQLYDDEWTDAFEVLVEAKYEEEDAVKTLLDTLESVHRFCEKKANLLLKNTEDAINHLFAEYKKTGPSPIKAGTMTVSRAQGKHVGKVVAADDLRDYALVDRWKPKVRKIGRGNKHIENKQVGAMDIEDRMKVLRKDVSESIVPMVQQAYFETRWDGDCLLALEPYIKRCIYICWMMVVQSPPMSLLLNAKPGEKFDHEAYASYTQNGPTIEYVVWPPMQLHSQGALVAKGVAQGKKEKQPN